MEIDHEIFSTITLCSLLIQEGQLSVSGERMCTILVYSFRGLSMPSKSVVRLSDHTPHDPNGLTGP